MINKRLKRCIDSHIKRRVNDITWKSVKTGLLVAGALAPAIKTGLHTAFAYKAGTLEAWSEVNTINRELSRVKREMSDAIKDQNISDLRDCCREAFKYLAQMQRKVVFIYNKNYNR